MNKALAWLCAIGFVLNNSAPGLANDVQDFNYAQKLTNSGHYLEATRILREIQRHRPNDVNILCELGCSYERNFNDGANGLDNAQKCFERALQIDPQCGRACYGMAMCLDSRGDFVKGIQFATRGLSTKKPAWENLKERAGALSNLKKDKEALADIELYIKKTNDKDPEVILQKATILENLKKFDLALVEYRSLLKASYEDSTV